MNILRLKIDGYKNLDNAEIIVNDFNSIIGLNNYGKSNFLYGIKFAFDFIKETSKNKNTMMRDIDAIPLNNVLHNRNFKFEMEFEDNKNNVVIYEFEFKWIESIIISENLFIKGNKGPLNKYLQRSYQDALYKSTVTARAITKLNIQNDELAINKLILNEGLFYNELLSELNEISFDLNSFLSIEEAFNTVHVDSIDMIERNRGHNISKVIYYLMENHIDKYELLIDSFKTLIPTIEDVSPLCWDIGANDKERFANVSSKIHDKMYMIRIKEKNNLQPIDINYLSIGTKRIFIVLTTAVLANMYKTPLVAFEELENSVHPYLFQKLLIILKELMGESKMIISSHSPYIINYLDIENIYLGVQNDLGTAYFRRIKSKYKNKIYKLANDEGVALGDYIFNLLVDSYKDNSELLTLLEENNG